MTITVATTGLIEALTDALACTEKDPELMRPGIHIATHRAEWGDEPGKRDVLAVTACDGFVVGHSTIGDVDGQLVPSVWPATAAQTVIGLCKQLVAARGKEHTVDIEVVEVVPDGDVSGDDKPDHPGFVVTLCETPALFDTDTEFQFHADHESKFPLATVFRVLTCTVNDADVPPPGPAIVWSPRVMAPLTAIAKRRKEVMQLFSVPGQRARLVQIGPFWLGAAMPALIPGVDDSGPSIEPMIAVPAAANDALREALQEMAADGITVTVENPKGVVAQTLSRASADVGEQE